ncbi:MAG: hypothetical protein KAI24_17770 [Planctomycetes bacterium]|nr:hypothetical protein [Planctomycetota bacterium]
MHKTLTAVIAALLGSSFVPVDPAPLPAAPMLPGPGGVAATVTRFFERLDAGKDVAPMLDVERHDLEFAFVDGVMKQVPDKEAAVPCFHDVAADGTPFAARSVAAFVTALDHRVASQPEQGRAVQTEVERIRANCQSEACSLAVVDFTRTYRTGEDQVVRRKLRATALLRWERHEQGDFRIYHWQASARE